MDEIQTLGALHDSPEIQEQPVYYLCLGPLSTLAHVLETDPHLAERIDSIYFSGTGPHIEPSWNRLCDPDAFQAVLDRAGKFLAFARPHSEEPALSADFLETLANVDSRGGHFISALHHARPIRGLVDQGHLKFWDDLIPLYLNDPSLGEMRSVSAEQAQIYQLVDWQTKRAKARYMELLSSVRTPSFAEQNAEPASEAPVYELEAAEIAAIPLLEEVSLSNGTLVNSVGKEQLRMLGASDLAGALRRVPGVTVSRFNSVGAFGGGDGGGVFIRGHGSGRPGSEIMTMVDGVPRFNGIWTHPLLDMVSIDIAERIDVYKSPQPVLFGNMAFGAVNLVPKTMQSKGRTTRLLGAAGKHETFTALAENGFGADGLRSWVTLSHRQSDGHRENADGEVNNFYGNFAHTINDHWESSVLVNHQNGRANDPRAESAAPIPVVERYETESTFFVGTLAHKYEALSGFLKVYWEAGETEWHQYDTGPPPPIGEAYTNFTEFDNYGIRLQERLELENGTAITAGYDLQLYGGSVDDIYETSAAANDRQPERRLRNDAVYVNIDRALDFAGGTFTPSAGLRYNLAREFDDEYGAQASLTYTRDNTRIYGNLARAFNYPGLYAAIFSDRWSGFGLSPDAWKDLDAETVLHYEIGVEQRLAEWGRLTVSVYYDEVSDALDFDSPPPPVSLTNTGDYQLFGTEVFLFLTPTEDLDLFIGGAYQNPSPSEVPNYPEFSLSVGANLRLSTKWSLNADAQYVDSRFTQGTRFNPGTQEVDRYLIVNARLAYAIDIWNGKLKGELFGAVENLTDTDYAFRPGYPMPGIMPSIGFDVRF
jgi:iron complex outermembrane receptor protein